MQSSSEQPLVGEERYVTTLTTAAKETKQSVEQSRTKQLCVPLSSRQLQKDQETLLQPQTVFINGENK